MNRKTLLWLDDCRNPLDTRVDWLAFSPIGRNVDVVWLKDADSFMAYIAENGLPDAICFDHDLAEDSYDERTGYDCAKFVVDYCMDHHLDIPPYSIQSSNPVGAENIRHLMDNYHRYYQQR